MTKEEAIDVIKDAGFGYLATVEGNQPRVRPMMPYLTDDNQFLVAFLGRARSLEQIKKNPQIEVCFVDRKMWYCRITGKAKLTEDVSKKEMLWEGIPMLKQYFSGPQDKNFFMVEIEIERLEAMTPHQKTPEFFSWK